MTDIKTGGNQPAGQGDKSMTNGNDQKSSTSYNDTCTPSMIRTRAPKDSNYGDRK